MATVGCPICKNDVNYVETVLDDSSWWKTKHKCSVCKNPFGVDTTLRKTTNHLKTAATVAGVIIWALSGGSGGTPPSSPPSY